MRQFVARILLASFLLVQIFSISVIANDTTNRESDIDLGDSIETYETPFESTLAKPYEIEVASVGKWFSTYYEPGRLAFGYKGDFSEMQSRDLPWPQTFHVSQTTRIISVNFATQGMASDISEVFFQDSKGNYYGGFKKTTETMIGLAEVSNSAVDSDILISVDETTTDLKKNSHSLKPTYSMVLPKGDYTILYSASGTDSQVNPFYIQGYNESKYQDYLRDVDDERRAWDKKQAESAGEDILVDDETMITDVIGDEELQEWYDSFINGKNGPDIKDNYATPDTYLAPVFELDTTMSLDQIILDTYNNGTGARPGIISLYNEAGEVLYEFQTQGASMGDVGNSLWVAFPEVTLEKGTYYLEIDNPQALGYDDSGAPIFSVSLSTIKPPLFDFTGSYNLTVAVTKSSTLMGDVSGAAPSFSLNGHPISVLDKGSSIEVMGTYNGMQFSQDCKIMERTENTVSCIFGFMANLSNLPYEAIIGANVLLKFERTPDNNVLIDVTGKGSYDRAASKTKGADYNIYAIAGNAVRVTDKLPMYVMAALAKLYGVGNIPGPNSPVEALVGLLFPSLLGVVVSVVQGLISAKENAENAENEVYLSPGQKAMKDANNSLSEALGSGGKLSVGEQAMKDANNSLGQGLTSKEEKDAWAKYADALGASGGDPEDSVSMGDNESIPASSGNDDSNAGDYSDYDETNSDSSDFNDSDSNNSNDGDTSFESNNTTQDSAQTTDDSNRPDFGKPASTKDGTRPDDSTQPGSESTGNDMSQTEEPITAVVPTNTKGSTKLVQYDPKTNSWFDPETGSEYNHDKNMEFLGEEEKRLKDYHDRNDYLNKTKQTAMDDYIKEFQNANKKLLNYDKMQKAKVNQAILEAEMEDAKQGTSPLGILNQTKVNIIDDLDEAADTIKQTAKDVSKAAYEEFKAIKKDISSDPEFWSNYKNNIWSGAKEITHDAIEMVKHPIDTLKDVKDMTKQGYEVGKNIANNAYKGAKAVLTDPAKAWEFVKDATGIKDFIESQDMNKSLIKRIGSVLTGTLKLGTTIATLGEAKAAAEGLSNILKGGIEGGKGLIKNTWDDLAGASVKTSSKPSLTSKGIQKELSFTEKGTYITSKNPPNMNGMTSQSTKAIQNVCDDMGVRVQARPTSKYAKAQIESGNALPKPPSVKVKTADVYDELLGGPKDAKGLTVIYEPKLPPKEVLSKYSQETQQKIQQQFDKRMSDFTKKDDLVKELKSNGFDLSSDGKIIVRDPIDPTKTKYIAGDNDIYDITNFDGSPLTDKQKQMVMDKLVKDPNANVLHGAHMDWKPGGKAYSPTTKAEISYGHTQQAGKSSGSIIDPEGDGLVTFNPLSNPTKSFQNGTSGLSPDEQKAFMDKMIKHLKGGA